ncbi:MAG: hypothetical protein KBT31_06235, partial [Firmicutes bacterium]|nr:hypothetical protein [Candidatus Colimorpha enterica]
MAYTDYAKQAFEETCDPKTAVKHGVKGGFPFWNAESTMFLYAPAFHFTSVKCCKRYRFDALDADGKVHSFETDDCCASLAPIWRDIPVGVVKLTVTAISPDGSDYATIGARTFFRSSPFTGIAPAARRSYLESALMGYRFAMNEPYVRHWLEYGTPDPGYDLNVYPSKMISSLIRAMINFARISPDDAGDAMKVAVNAADYLIGITPRGNVPLADLPQTYWLDYCPDPEKYGVLTPNWRAAEARVGTMMMFYCAEVGYAYLKLEAATGDGKYLTEALKIGEYFCKTVEPNGSWYLVRSTETGEPTVPNYIAPLEDVVPFLNELYKRTGNEKWKTLADNAVRYAEEKQLSVYNWEGQFEDTRPTANYMNLTHYGPISLAEYYVENYGDDPVYLEKAKELVRFAEDQFVIWGEPYPWEKNTPTYISDYDTSNWHTPCALEQYFWYVPIDASADFILRGFLVLYKAGCGDIYLAKAKVLADQLTVVQKENGLIPTHWFGTKRSARNFWYNCMFA